MTEMRPTIDSQLAEKLQKLGLSETVSRAPEIFATAARERWTPSEFLRRIADIELEHRAEVELTARLAEAAFPDLKTLEEFVVAESSISQDRVGYLASLSWLTARENLVLVGPAGTGKTHLLTGLGLHAIQAGFHVRYFAAVELVESLYRALADNSVGRVIDEILDADFIILDEMGFYPLDDIGCQLLFRFVAAAYERRSLGVASHWPFESWGRFLPERTTAVSLLDRLLHHSVVVVTTGESFRLREAKTRERPWRRPEPSAAQSGK